MITKRQHLRAEARVYRLIRPLLFALDAETAHRLALQLMRRAWQLPGTASLVRRCQAANAAAVPVEVMGLLFPNPVGLAAGLDKEGCCAAAFLDLGFGFVELGTVTPRPQSGNPRPRLFRLTRQDAIINRMGFNSGGLAAFTTRLPDRPHRNPIGINLGRNRDSPAAHALDDYILGMRAVYAYADYITINISSPNTPGLRDLQEASALDALLAGLKREQAQLRVMHGRQVPLALKIAPDLDGGSIDAIARRLLDHRFEAVIATNTTLERPGLEAEPLAREAGGLSGRPLAAQATRVVRRLHATLQGRVPIIGVGGIFSADDAWQRLVAGADLVQIYSAFIYRGPRVVREIVAGLDVRRQASGCPTLTEAVHRARAEAAIP